MNRPALVCLALLVLVAVPLIAVADGEPPLADAGLDQTVSQGTTVHLDGGGSHAPDGTIEAYDWVVTTPSGHHLATSDPTNRTSSFEPVEIGTYEVTLTVTDDAGREASDTLYVHVEAGDPPSVTLEGPDDVVVGDSGTFSGEVEAGDAPIDRVIWTVRGEEVAVRDGEVAVQDASPTEQALEHTFETLGEHAVTVRVVDTAGQTAVDSHTVDVGQPDEGEDDSEGGSGGSGPPGWYDGVAQADDPVIDGPQEVIEDEPLTAAYTIDSNTGSSIASTTWRVDGEPVASGTTFEPTWEPGTYELTALVEYRDGSQRIATFADGSRTVVAKPPVDLRLEGVDGYNGTVTGAVVAEDAIGSLRAVEVYVDGKPAESVTLQSVDRHEFEFAVDHVEDHEEVDVTAVAVDDYEHEVRVSEAVTVVGVPELVSVEILNDPVDSYHERIDEERYTAEVEVVVDLNQYPVEGVDVRFDSDDGIKYLGRETVGDSSEHTQTLSISHDFPEEYSASISLVINDRSQEILLEVYEGELVVRESPPEARLQVNVEDGKNPHERRIQMDASDSFDPDYSDLSYSWSPDQVEKGETWSGSVKNLNEPIELAIEDSYGIETRVERVLSQYYSPTLNQYWLVNDTYTTREYVEIQFKTERHVMDDEEFYPADVRFELLHSEGTVDAGKDTAEQESRWIGSITMPVQSYLEGKSPVLKIYNAENPDQTDRYYELPRPDFDLSEEFYLNVEVATLEYLIQKPVYDTISTESATVRDLTLDEGYEVHSINREYEYVIEEYYEIEAVYETETAEFTTEVQRQFFLDGASDGWGNAGTRTETDTERTVSYEWRNSITRSEYTGTSRTRTIRSAQYRTEYQYRSRFGGTYWSTTAFSRYDTRTGSTRRVKVRDAITRTEYRHKVVEYRTVENEYYIAEKTELVRPSSSGWREYETTHDEGRMEILTRSDELRVGGVNEYVTWNLRKQTDTEYETVQEVENESDVVETNAVVVGDIAHERIHRSELIVEIVDEFRKDVLHSEYKTREEILNEVLLEEAREDPCVEQTIECSIEQ